MVRSTGFHRSSGAKVLKIDDMSTEKTLKEMGIDPDAEFKKAIYSSRTEASPGEVLRTEVAVGNADRPSNIFYKMTNKSSHWYMYAIMDWYRSEVSVLSTIVSRFGSELFRYGIKLEPKFVFKCENCGHELQNHADECPICHSKKLRKPDETQKDYFRMNSDSPDLIHKANRNRQPLREVLRDYAEQQMLYNQSYLVCITGDFYDPRDGHLIENYPLEFITWNPQFVRNLYDDKGVQGTMYGYTKKDRNSLITLDGEGEDIRTHTDEGLEIYPAFWQIGSTFGGSAGAGDYVLFSEEEIYQSHWFRPSLTYGKPIWFDIEDDLLAYHYIEKHNLKKYKFGYIRKMIILPGFNDDDVEDITKGIADILAKNDNSIPIVCLPPQLQNVAEMRAQTLELGTESTDLMQNKDDIRNRICAHGGLPNIFAGDVEASGGMNNESQQITILDRYLLGPYYELDLICEWIMSWYPMITDWILVVDRPTRAYTDHKKRIDNLQEAAAFKQMGFDVFYCDGKFNFSSEPVDQIMRRQQMQMQQQQAMMGAVQGGIFPGDGSGPPEKGSARRENDEIDANKDELDQTKRDGKGSVEL